MELNYDNRNTTVYYRDERGDIEQCTYAEFVREFGGNETTTPNGVAPRKFIDDKTSYSMNGDFNPRYDVMEWQRYGQCRKQLSTHNTMEAAECELFEYWESYMQDSDQTPYYTTDKNNVDL